LLFTQLNNCRQQIYGSFQLACSYKMPYVVWLNTL